MSGDPAFLLYVDDWLSSLDIAVMTPAEEGAYIRLLCYAWQDPKCRLPNNDEELAKLSRLGQEWHNGSGARIRKCFRVVGDHIVNDRQLEERKKRDAWREKSSLGGVKGSKSRWSKRTRGGKGTKKVVIAKRLPNDDTRVVNGNEDQDHASASEALQYKGWRNSLDEYLGQEAAAYLALINDAKWIAEQERLNPGLDVRLSLEKAHTNFWGTEAGWRHKKRKRIGDINWKRTFVNALALPMNRVWRREQSGGYFAQQGGQ